MSYVYRCCMNRGAIAYVKDPLLCLIIGKLQPLTTADLNKFIDKIALKRGPKLEPYVPPPPLWPRVIPEKPRPPTHNAHVWAFRASRHHPNHDEHVWAWRERLGDPDDDNHPLSIALRPRGATEGEETAIINPKGKLVTVNDWAKDKGLDLSLSQATELGMRAAKLYEAKYGMPPSTTPSWKGPRFSAYVRDMRRPWKDKDKPPSYLPQHLLNRVGEYPKAIIERAWRMVQAIEKAR
jgi:hypothetical protein